MMEQPASISTQSVEPKKKSYRVLVLGCFVILLLLGGALFITKQSEQNDTPKSTPIPTSSTSFSIFPATKTIQVGEALTVSVTVDSQKEILATDLFLTFDPQVFEATKITPGTFFENPVIAAEKIDNKDGKILYSIASVTPKQTKGELVIISLKAKKTAPLTKLSIDEQTLVSVKGAEMSETIISSVGTFTVR